MYTRLINPTKSKRFFLFGPRQTGKSTFVRSLIESKDLYIDLLPQRTYLHYAKHPGLLREEILAHAQKNLRFRCIIDEIQKIPELLDEVHEMIENKGIQFVMTGSSARKLRRGGVNLLAGRAYTYRLFPLTFFELYFILDQCSKSLLLIEDFFINSQSSSIIGGSKNLQQDVSYILTIKGTHSVWKTSEWLNNENNWQEVPENEPIFFDGEPSNNYVGADAAFSFSCPNSTFCIEEELPEPNPFFLIFIHFHNWLTLEVFGIYTV